MGESAKHHDQTKQTDTKNKTWPVDPNLSLLKREKDGDIRLSPMQRGVPALFD